MRTLILVAHDDGRFELRRTGDGTAAPALTTTDPRHLGRMIEAWATAAIAFAAATNTADPVATRPPPPGRSYLNSRADQEGIATPSRWPAAALRHRPGDAA